MGAQSNTQAAVKVDELQTPIIKTKEELKNLTRKLATEKNNLSKQQDEAAKHKDLLKVLDEEITQYQKQEAELEAGYEELKKSGSGEGSAVLTEEQETEYEQVREMAAVASAKPRITLNQSKEKLEAARRKAGDIETELKEVVARKDESAKSVKVLTERRDTLMKVCVFHLMFSLLHVCL